MSDLAVLLHPSVCLSSGVHRDVARTIPIPLCHAVARSLTERGLTVVPETALAVVAAAKAWHKQTTFDWDSHAGNWVMPDPFGLHRAVDAHRAATGGPK